MSDLNYFKNQAKKLFKEIEDVDLINTYGPLYKRLDMISCSLGYKNFQDVIFDSYNQEGLLNYYQCEYKNEYDYLSKEEPSLFYFVRPDFICENNEIGGTSIDYIAIEDDHQEFSSRLKFANSTLIIQEVSQYPKTKTLSNDNYEINILKNSESLKIDPINFVIQQKEYCLKFFSTQISQWVHELVNILCKNNYCIDISTFKHIFNLRYLWKVKEKSALLAKYFNDLKIDDIDKITQEQIAKHSKYCANAMRMSDIIHKFPNCFENICNKDNHYQIIKPDHDKITHLYLNSTIDDEHFLASDMAMTTFLNLSLNEKTEAPLQNNELTTEKKFKSIHIFGILKHHTFPIYTDGLNYRNIKIYIKARNLKTLTDWQREILFNKNNHTSYIFSNKEQNLSPEIPFDFKKRLFQKYKLTDEFRTKFHGSYEVTINQSSGEQKDKLSKISNYRYCLR